MLSRVTTLAPNVFVIDLPAPNFHALYEALNRVRAAEKTEDAWTAMHAAQGNYKGMRRWVKGRWGAFTQDEDKPKTQDLKSLLSALPPETFAVEKEPPHAR